MIVGMVCIQTIAGVDNCERESKKVVFYDSLKYAISGSMLDVGVDNIKNLTASCITRRLDTVSVSYWRRLATALSSSIYVSYLVKVRNPKTNYQELSKQLQDSVERGYFAELLMSASYSYNISAFNNVTSYDITVEDVTVYPSDDSSRRHDSTEAIFISILVLVSCLIVVVIISVVIVILRITAVVIHPTAAGGGGGEYVTDDKI